MLLSYTGKSVAEHVLQKLKTLEPDTKNVMLTSCHDGAVNMTETSRLLEVSNWYHCAAHALHLLLTIDSINNVETFSTLLQKCKEVITTSHFKSALIDEGLAYMQNKAMIENLQQSTANIHIIIDLDDQFPISEGSDEENSDCTEVESRERTHKQQSLKSSVVTKWNFYVKQGGISAGFERSNSECIEANRTLQSVFKEIELSLLAELKGLLCHFKKFSDLYSSNMPALSAVLLIKKKISDISMVRTNKSFDIKNVKRCILKNLDKRFPVSDAC